MDPREVSGNVRKRLIDSSTASTSSSSVTLKPYVSKRGRTSAEQQDCSPTQVSPKDKRTNALMDPLPNIPTHIHHLLEERESEGMYSSNRVPRKLLFRLHGHSKGVNCIKWSPTTGHLLASAGMDNLAIVWSPKSDKGDKGRAVRTISCHLSAIQDVCWSFDSRSLLSASFDRTVKLTDTETGINVLTFAHASAPTSVKIHPVESNIFVSGESSGGQVNAWDVRDHSRPIWKINAADGRILDVEFSPDGNQLLASLHSRKTGGMDQTISVWDFKRQIQLSNQIHLGGYVCPSLKYHPTYRTFIAQTHGDYIAVFSGKHPFKQDPRKLFKSHQVAGFRIHCGFSSDGTFLGSGSADGTAVFYSWSTCKVIKLLNAHEGVCTDVNWHPVLPSMVATCGWDGTVAVWE